MKDWTIRPYEESDYELISLWWRAHGEMGPCPGMMSPHGTFVLESHGKRLMSLTVYLTQSKEIAYLEGYISDPTQKRDADLGAHLWNHCFEWTKKQGYKRLVCIAPNDKLCLRYQDLGMTKTLKNVSMLVREL